jgi:hypothetical protein
VALLRRKRIRFCRGISSVGRAIALQAIGHRFDPGILHQEISCGERQPPFANDRSVTFGPERVRYTSTAHDVNAKARVLPKASKQSRTE